MEDWQLPPGEKPLFADPDRLAAHYKQLAEEAEQEKLNFDSELERLDQLRTDMPPRGKGVSRGYEQRWKLIALYYCLGYTGKQIGQHLGYSSAGISLALKQPFVMEEIKRLREEYANPDAKETMLRATSAAALRLERAILDPADKTGHDAAKFVLEKVTGKARQEVQVESGTILDFMSLVREMNARTERPAPREVLEVGPGASGPSQRPDTEHRDKWDAWLDANMG